MRTPKQTAASHANGAKSKGPVTPQGKLNSARNSIRHGLFADTIVLEAEKKEEFFVMLNELLDEHRPSTPTETMMVEAIASARWRQDRIWGMQKVAFDQDVSSSPDTSAIPPLRAVLSLQSSPDKVRSHELLLRYDIALDRQISRALLRLQQLQDRRAQRTAGPVESSPVESNTLGPIDIEAPEHPDPEHPDEGSPSSLSPEPLKNIQPAGDSVAPRTATAKSAPQPLHFRKDVPAKRTQQLNENNKPSIARTLPSSNPKVGSGNDVKPANREVRRQQ